MLSKTFVARNIWNFGATGVVGSHSVSYSGSVSAPDSVVHSTAKPIFHSTDAGKRGGLT